MITTNKLNFKFLKTITKPVCLNAISAKIRSFIFTNTLIKSLKLGLKIIFLDESNFQIQKNYLKIWRQKDYLPFFKFSGVGRKSIIEAISNKELIRYKINEGANNDETFLEFLKELNKANKNKKNQDSLIVIGNCSIHMTKN